MAGGRAGGREGFDSGTCVVPRSNHPRLARCERVGEALEAVPARLVRIRVTNVACQEDRVDVRRREHVVHRRVRVVGLAQVADHAEGVGVLCADPRRRDEGALARGASRVVADLVVDARREREAGERHLVDVAARVGPAGVCLGRAGRRVREGAGRRVVAHERLRAGGGAQPADRDGVGRRAVRDPELLGAAGGHRVDEGQRLGVVVVVEVVLGPHHLRGGGKEQCGRGE